MEHETCNTGVDFVEFLLRQSAVLLCFVLFIAATHLSSTQINANGPALVVNPYMRMQSCMIYLIFPFCRFSGVTVFGITFLIVLTD